MFAWGAHSPSDSSALSSDIWIVRHLDRSQQLGQALIEILDTLQPKARLDVLIYRIEGG